MLVWSFSVCVCEREREREREREDLNIDLCNMMCKLEVSSKRD